MLSAEERYRLPLTVVLMLFPWVCAALGFYVIRDYRVTMLMYGFLCCVLPVVLFKRQPIRFFPAQWASASWLGLLLLFSLLILGLFYFTGFGVDSVFFRQQAGRINLTLNRQAVEYGLYFVIFNPMFEEAFWRGFIYEEWKRLLSPQWARIISSVFFGAWHWMLVQFFCPPVWSLLMAVAVMLAGFVFARLYDKTGTLGASVLLHGLGADLPLMLIVLSLLNPQ